MKRKRYPILSWDLFNRKKNGKTAACVLLLFLLNIFCNLDWYMYMLEYGTHQAVVVFLLGISSTAWFFPVMLSITAAVPVYGYCSEWKHGYWKPVIERIGKERYMQEKPLACFIQSFLIYFAGQLLYVLLLVVSAKLCGAPIAALKDGSICPVPEHPYYYMLLCCLSLAMAAGFWSSLAFLLASWQMDLFMAIVVPLASYFSLTYLLSQSVLHLDLRGVALLQLDWEHPGISFLFSVLFFGALSVLCISGARKLIARRIENEHVS